MKLEDLLKDVSGPEKDSPCEGLVFRAKVETFWGESRNTIGRKIYLRKLKRQSCPGCIECLWMKDAFHDGVPIVNWDEIEDGKIYTLGITNIYTDRETGYVEDYDLTFISYRGKTMEAFDGPKDA